MINIIGLGPGEFDYITKIGEKLIYASDILIGGKRNLESIKDFNGEKIILSNNLKEILDFIKNKINEHVAIVDNSFDDEKKLIKVLEKLQVETAIYANLVTIYTNAKTQEITDEIINSVKNIDADTINKTINQFSNFANKN